MNLPSRVLGLVPLDCLGLADRPTDELTGLIEERFPPGSRVVAEVDALDYGDRVVILRAPEEGTETRNVGVFVVGNVAPRGARVRAT